MRLARRHIVPAVPLLARKPRYADYAERQNRKSPALSCCGLDTKPSKVTTSNPAGRPVVCKLTGGVVVAEIVVGDDYLAGAGHLDRRNERLLPSGGMLVGVWFTLIGADQVCPPSVERESAIWSIWKPLKRASCQTA